MTWLSEVEANSKKFRDEVITPQQNVGGLQYIGETPRERMARVIRELVKVADVAEWVWNEIREDDDAGYIIDDVKCVPALKKALRNLSPDAKEIVDDSKAKSST